jgi:hypothetical protein
MNKFTEARKRIFDDKQYRGASGFAYKESEKSCAYPGCGIITYPCCIFCGKRVGEDNRDFRSGRYCDDICRIADDMRIYEEDYKDEEIIEEERLKQLLLNL